ncbi:hypothetical protein CTI12_AA502520 [Artemisia annua]|nr:hypothetical protein CTI12_AA502520 [Artemisia annua]
MGELLEFLFFVLLVVGGFLVSFTLVALDVGVTAVVSCVFVDPTAIRSCVAADNGVSILLSSVADTAINVGVPVDYAHIVAVYLTVGAVTLLLCTAASDIFRNLDE